MSKPINNPKDGNQVKNACKDKKREKSRNAVVLELQLALDERQGSLSVKRALGERQFLAEKFVLLLERWAGAINSFFLIGPYFDIFKLNTPNHANLDEFRWQTEQFPL